MKRVILLIICCFFISKNFGQCLSDWKYYMPFTLKNNVASALSDYQVKLTINTATIVSDGKMNADGNDIRFTDPSSCDNIPYWIESGMNTPTTVIWVKVASLPASGTASINMYYGNSSAAAASDGASTFLVFDDFTGSSLASQWNTFGSVSSYNVSSGSITVSCGSGSTVGSRLFVSSANLTPPVIAEGMISSTVGFYTEIGLANSGTMSGYSLNLGDASASANGGMDIGQNYANTGSMAFHIQAQTMTVGTVTGVWSLAWPSTGVQLGTWPGGSLSASTTSLSQASTVNLFFGNAWTSNGASTFDWVRARKYASTEPTITAKSEAMNHTSGINMVSNSGETLKLYPNPATEMLKIQFPTGYQRIQIIDNQGRMIRDEHVESGIQSLDLNIASIPKGFYAVKISGIKGNLVNRLIVQ